MLLIAFTMLMGLTPIMANGRPHIQVSDPTQQLMAAMEKILLPYQKLDIASDARFRLCRWSRQTGKSFSKTLRRILRGARRNRNQIFLSAGERQSKELIAKAKQHLQAMEILFEYEENVFKDTDIKQMEIILPSAFGGIRIIGLPANPDTARGFTGDLFLDEFAIHKKSREIWAAAYPSVMRKGGEVDVASTPKGKRGMFYDLDMNPTFESDVLTIYDAVEQGLEVDLEALKAGAVDSELWRQEFLCEYIDEASAFLPYELIAACMDDKLPRQLDVEALAQISNDVYVGIDIGRKHDLTALWAFEQVGSQLISLGLIELRSTPFRLQFEIISHVLNQRCVRRCAIDNTGLGMQLAEQLVERFGDYRVEAVTFTGRVKENIAGKMRVKFEDRNIRIPAFPELREDLHSVEKSVTLAGNVRLQAAREGGSHADRFWAGALAVYAGSDGQAGPISFTPGDRRNHPGMDGGGDDLDWQDQADDEFASIYEVGSR